MMHAMAAAMAATAMTAAEELKAAFKEQPDHGSQSELAAMVHNLASVREAQGQLSEAAEGYERAMRIKEKAYVEQPNHPALAATVRAVFRGAFWRGRADRVFPSPLVSSNSTSPTATL